MSLNGNDRAMAMYNAVSAQGSFSMLNAQEKATVLKNLQTCYAADTGYLTGNATILPDSLANNAGQPVQVVIPGGSGTTVSPQTIVGTGRLA